MSVGKSALRSLLSVGAVLVGESAVRSVLSVGALSVGESAGRSVLFVDASCLAWIKVPYDCYYRTIGRLVGALSVGKHGVGSVLSVGRCFIR